MTYKSLFKIVRNDLIGVKTNFQPE